jgi:hypothetical protein
MDKVSMDFTLNGKKLKCVLFRKNFRDILGQNPIKITRAWKTTSMIKHCRIYSMIKLYLNFDTNDVP